MSVYKVLIINLDPHIEKTLDFDDFDAALKYCRNLYLDTNYNSHIYLSDGKFRRHLVSFFPYHDQLDLFFG